MPLIAPSVRFSRPQSAAGFTVVELVITVAIAVLLLVIALPNFRATMISSNVTSTTNQLINALNVARSEAVRRGTLVAVISTGGNWSNGWSIVTDDAFLGTGVFNPSATNTLQNASGVNTSSGYKVTALIATAACTGAPATASSQIIFNGQGNQPCDVTAFNINVCSPAGAATSKWLTVAPSGKVSTQTNTTASPAPAC